MSLHFSKAPIVEAIIAITFRDNERADKLRIKEIADSIESEYPGRTPMYEIVGHMQHGHSTILS